MPRGDARSAARRLKRRNMTSLFSACMKCASCGSSITAEMQKGHAYYRCTKKGGACQEKHYLREEILREQIQLFLQKISLSDGDTEKALVFWKRNGIRRERKREREIDVLKNEIARVETKLSKLLDAYLADALSQQEYAAKKEQLLSRKIGLHEKISDFERQGAVVARTR